ncbi:MAG: oxidoreductase, partial [Proteobacteria bacterium]|nr:oxidoreductase [Pseudomonadota bacterium]
MPVSPADPAEAGTYQVRVTSRDLLAEDIVALRLQPVGDGTLSTYEAGAHVELHLPNGMVRQYSLCDAPGGDGYRIAVLREASGRGGSTCVHEALREGSELRVGTPRNLFPLHPAPHALLLAGGIGITPLMAMAEVLARQGASFSLHACARHRGRAAFFDELAVKPWASQVHWHLDDGPPEQRLSLERVLAASPAGSHAWICGPDGFIAYALAACTQAAWSDERVHVERFSASATDASGTASTGFDVQWAPTGQVLHVPPERSVASVLREAGLPVALSCEQGICGTCLLRVCSGQPEHRDMFLSAEEQAANDRFTPCCSRALSGR